MMKYFRHLAIAAAVCLAGCSGNSTAPTASGPPNVAGSYSGTVTITTSNSLVTCPAQTTVNQNGANVTFGSLVFTGPCAPYGSFQLGEATLSNSGSLGSVTQTLFFASCSGVYDFTMSGGFSGNTLQFSLIYIAKSGGCVTQLGDVRYTGSLSR